MTVCAHAPAAYAGRTPLQDARPPLLPPPAPTSRSHRKEYSYTHDCAKRNAALFSKGAPLSAPHQRATIRCTTLDVTYIF
eukprot:165869-Prorocentrum_minimum.AAC.1